MSAPRSETDSSDADSGQRLLGEVIGIARAAIAREVVDLVVPADSGSPAASDVGSLRFLREAITEHPDWSPRLCRALDKLSPAPVRLLADAGDRDVEWLIELIELGFWADPENGGNHGRASWRMINWAPEPPSGWPALPPEIDISRAVLGADGLAPRYDAIVIGSGAGGGVAAEQLTRSGRTVLLIERGDHPTRSELSHDHLRNARTTAGFIDRTARADVTDLRILQVAGQPDRHLHAWDSGWGGNATTLGGGTRIYGAQAWRFSPADFTMATRYGTPENSALADWPITYDDMEPFYDLAEREIGVSGSASGDTSGAWRSHDYPMPALPAGRTAARLAHAARQLGINTLPVPLAINSIPYNGRTSCVGCRQCVGFACPVEAKNGSVNTTLVRAAATGRLSVMLQTRAATLVTDAGGHVTGVRLLNSSWGGTREVSAELVVVAAGAIESARLLLTSTSTREPAGIGNNRDQVGRHLQSHIYTGALGIFADEICDLVGPGPAVATNDFRHNNPDVIGGGMLANEFVPTPNNTRRSLRSAGLLAGYGIEAKLGMRRLAQRTQRIAGPVQEVTMPDSRLQLDRRLVDEDNLPVVRLSGTHHPEDDRTHAFLAARAAEWLTAAGATTVVQNTPPSHTDGPSAGQHQAGTLRMGNDPAHSVTDPRGRVHGHENLIICDGSTHVTNGGVNPVLTIFANAYRIMAQF